MEYEEAIEMETDEVPAPEPLSFQLQFDKSIPFQTKIAVWNPEKDLLAIVTDDSKVVLHRFNWQRLWMISPGKCVTSVCWRPDGKAIAIGVEDGSILLHDVENGKLIRSIKSHNVAVVCLNWEEDAQNPSEEIHNAFMYKDRTSRFFPPPPRIPRMPGVSSGDSGFLDDNEGSGLELSTAPHQRFNILCSGDKDGCICFSIFGIFPIGRVNIHQLPIAAPPMKDSAAYRLLNASVHKLSLSKSLCQLIVLCIGQLVRDGKYIHSDGENVELDNSSPDKDTSVGLQCLLLDTSIFLDRKNELHQVALQASGIEDLIEVIRASLSVMSKQWSDAMRFFHDKFDSLSSLIVSHGLDSNSQEEFLSLLYGARTSAALHQFLVNSLGEAGLKRVSKAVDSAGKELHSVIHEHLQPAVEIIGFRIAELRGLSRWRARYQLIGLNEKLVDIATEKAGMLLVQVQRFSRILAIVVYQFQNFFNWVLKYIKILMSEPTDQLEPANSELVVVFLKFFLDHDPVGQLLEVNQQIHVDAETMKQVEELAIYGGFSDTKYLERTLADEFNQLEQCLKEAFIMPFTTISGKIACEDFLSLYSLPSTSEFPSLGSPTSISFYKGDSDIDTSPRDKRDCGFVDYICFRVPDESSDCTSYVSILRGLTNGLRTAKKRLKDPEAALICIPDTYQCVDLSLYKDNQIVLLLNEATCTNESPGKSLLIMMQTNDLDFSPLSMEMSPKLLTLQELKASPMSIDLKNGRLRAIPDSAISPLAVSASRGLACVFSSRRHALVYILDEDEDEDSDPE